MATLIDYKDVKICQQEQIVLRNVNVTIHSGEMVYLLGKVGSVLAQDYLRCPAYRRG